MLGNKVHPAHAITEAAVGDINIFNRLNTIRASSTHLLHCMYTAIHEGSCYNQKGDNAPMHVHVKQSVCIVIISVQAVHICSLTLIATYKRCSCCSRTLQSTTASTARAASTAGYTTRVWPQVYTHSHVSTASFWVAVLMGTASAR
jgi:hypothetical protein